MKIQSVKNSIKQAMGKGRLFLASGAAAVGTLSYSGRAMAEGLETLGTDAGTKLEGIGSQLATPALAIIGIAVGIATVAVVLRLTKKA
jgi:hypothetical protein